MGGPTDGLQRKTSELDLRCTETNIYLLLDSTGVLASGLRKPERSGPRSVYTSGCRVKRGG